MRIHPVNIERSIEVVYLVLKNARIPSGGSITRALRDDRGKSRVLPRAEVQVRCNPEDSRQPSKNFSVTFSVQLNYWD